MRKALVATLTAVTLLVATAAPAWSYDREFARFTIQSLTSSTLMRAIIELTLLEAQNPPAECAEEVPVRIQRRQSGRWVTKKRGKTNRRGRFLADIEDKSGRYRAVAPAYTTGSGFECFKSVSNTVTHQAQ